MPHWIAKTLAAIALVALAVPAVAQFRVPGSASGQAGAGGQPPGGLRPSPQPATPAGAASRGPLLIDRIVAVVNRDVITQRDLNERVAVVTSQLRRQNTPLPPIDVLERQVLERMIMDRIQVQFARETGVRIEDAQLDRTIALIAEQNKLTPAEFRRALEREGIPFDKFRADIRDEMLIGRLREREVDGKIQIAESDVDNFLDEVQNATGVVEYNLAHILVRVPESASPEQVEARFKRAQEAQAKARSGADFAQLAVSFSDAPDALQGGGMGWRPQDRLPELIAAELVKMKPGEVTDVLRSPAGFHVVKLIDRRGGGAGSFVVQQTRARHILVRVNELVSEAEAQRKIALLRQRLIEGASFAELARLNSDDTVSAMRGGELGWVVPGDVVPEFERAMNQLKVGEISQPVRTQFGLHLIQVEDRRTADLAADRKRLEARKALRERRADEAYQDWLRQLRDRAYVEYRLEER